MSNTLPDNPPKPRSIYHTPKPEKLSVEELKLRHNKITYWQVIKTIVNDIVLRPAAA